MLPSEFHHTAKGSFKPLKKPAAAILYQSSPSFRVIKTSKAAALSQILPLSHLILKLFKSSNPSGKFIANESVLFLKNFEGVFVYFKVRFREKK